MEITMSSNKPTEIDDVLLIVQIVQVTGRLGLSMAGAMCRTFVAAQLTMTNAELFDSAGFIVLMVLVGILGLYLCIDLPHLRASLTEPELDRRRIESIELLSKIGTFLATIAALISVYAFVFGETLRRSFQYMVGSWRMIGVVLQIGAGLIGRIRLRGRRVDESARVATPE
jgi:Na+/melibiose symporter-like transporter